MNSKFLPSILLSMTGLLAISCSAPEEMAAEAPKARPKPAYVRVLNLSGCAGNVMDRGRPITSSTDDNPATSFAAIGSGSAKLSVKGACVDLPFKAELKPDEAATFVVGPQGKTSTWVQGELRHPTATENFIVVFLDASGTVLQTPPTIELKGTTSSVSLTPTKASQLLDPGTWEASSSALDAPLSLDIKAQNAYTLFLVKQANGKLHATFLTNTPPLTPMGTGASAS